jgi:hypothetical protein
MKMPKHTMDEMKRTVLQKGNVTIEIIEPGNLVFCDYCGEDWTERTESGGFLFGDKAVCPTCAPKSLASIKSYGEERYIRGTCPEGKSYADWVREDLR